MKHYLYVLINPNILAAIFIPKIQERPYEVCNYKGT